MFYSVKTGNAVLRFNVSHQGSNAELSETMLQILHLTKILWDLTGVETQIGGKIDHIF